jgi:TonB-linked SusC/RagA family outer membrane protein
MMKRLSLTLASLFLFVGLALAQTTVKGTVVTYEDNEPIIGASIQVVGATNIGTITDVNGNFSLQVPAGRKTLRITYVGMEPLEVAVTDKPIRIQLRNDANNLDEVIVVAYGTQKKTSLTGSIQEVKSEAIEMRPTSSVASALEGTVTGVQVNSTYGVPGNDPSIRIRGIGTVNGSSSPLYIVDGVPFGGNISDLNPQDIESMSVLKDAASAALYGNRASNGVILITTKKGKQGRLNVTLDIKQGSFSKGIPEYDRMDAAQWMEAQWLNMKNNRMAAGDDAATAADYATKNLISETVYLNIFNAADDALFTSDGKLTTTQIKGTYGEDLDWYDQAIHNGYRQEYNLSANGATDKADYLLSLGYLDEDGYLKTNGFDRISGRVAVNIQPKKWFKTGLNLNVTHQTYDSRYGTSDGGYTNPFMYCRNIAPIYPVHLHDVNTGQYILDDFGQKQYDGGSYIDSDGQVVVTRNQYQNRHLMWENELNQDKTIRNTMNAIAYADFYLPYNFTFTLKGNLNTRHSEENEYNNAEIGDGQGNSGRGKRIDYRYKNWAFQQQLHWNKEFGVHSVDALIGHENYHYTYNYLYGYKTTQVFPDVNNLNNFTEITSLYDYNDTYRTESYLGRVRYGYDNRYNLEASFRRDGSSRFAKDARWGNFWSVGANWVISNEDFMKSIEWVNYLKLRADYGEVGNDAGSGYYGYMALYNSTTPNANQGSFWIGQLPNEDLKWETGQSWGVGLDGRLFNRLNFSIEYFDKRNKDLLFDVYNPLSAGATSTSSAESVITKNLGIISNKGVEISADVDVLKNRDWRINVGANITLLKNKVVELPEQNKDGIIDGTKKIVEGKDRYAFYTYTWEGINTKNGFSLYKFNDEDYFFKVGDQTYGDAENGAEITGESLNAVVVIDGVPYSYMTTYGKREFHGSAIPDAYGSFNFTVSWKGLSLYTLFTYQLGGKIMDSNYSSLMTPSTGPYSLHAEAADGWRVEQATANDAIDPSGIPVLSSASVIPGTSLKPDLNSTSSRWLTSASYLILKNINLTYQLPKSLVRKVDLEGVAVTVACENLFTKTARKGMNPQQNFSGTQSNTFVTPRVFSVGLNVKF